MARLGQALKPSKPPQQLSKASEPHNPPQQLSQASHLLCHDTSLGPTSCFYWASKLPCGTLSAGLKTFKTSAAAFEGLRTSQPSAAAFSHGTSLGPTSCFYWASKLLRGTFGASLKTLKTSAAAFEGLRTSQPSAAAFEGVPLASPWYLPRPTSCFYWASKLLRGTFWAGLKTLKTSAAAFQGLRTSQPSAAAFEGRSSSFRRPQNLTTPRSSFRSWYLPRPSQPSDEQTRKSLISIHSIHCPTIYVYTT